mmetsp:Transcript_9848/g.34720  ORF Transcript_9848/g.34720 Transcript_9848/m.34720 type:complete len:317 (+) Transcript_9848:726-1676(+)
MLGCEAKPRDLRVEEPAAAFGAGGPSVGAAEALRRGGPVRGLGRCPARSVGAADDVALDSRGVGLSVDLRDEGVKRGRVRRDLVVRQLVVEHLDRREVLPPAFQVVGAEAEMDLLPTVDVEAEDADGVLADGALGVHFPEHGHEPAPPPHHGAHAAVRREAAQHRRRGGGVAKAAERLDAAKAAAHAADLVGQLRLGPVAAAIAVVVEVVDDVADAPLAPQIGLELRRIPDGRRRRKGRAHGEQVHGPRERRAVVGENIPFDDEANELAANAFSHFLVDLGVRLARAAFLKQVDLECRTLPLDHCWGAHRASTLKI